MTNNAVISNLHAFIENGAKKIYIVFVIVSCIGYIVDIFSFMESNANILLINLTTITVTLVSFLFYYIKKLGIKISFGIIIYTALLNVIIDSLSNPFMTDRILFFFRDSLFIIILITLTSLIIHKVHSIFISLVYIAALLALTLITGSNFLTGSLYIIIPFISVYAVLIYYMVSLIERSIRELDENSRIIKEKSELVNETNTELEERQQLIEEQSEILLTQTEKLTEQTALMSSKNSELEQVNAAKDKFLSVLAHDLNNPLSVIAGFADLLSKRYHELDDEKRIKYIGILNSTTYKTLELLSKLLTWGKSITNTISFEPKEVNIGSLIEKNVSLLVSQRRTKKIEVVKEIQPECITFADENMIETVIRNLFTNAVKYTPEGGGINISCIKQENEILVKFTDTGIGMDEETRKNLFI